MKDIRIAILDLYAGEKNKEISSLKNLLEIHTQRTAFDTFDARGAGDFPDLDDYDLVICSGGPGNPNEDEGLWSSMFYQWIEGVWAWNQQRSEKKYVFFICHSFQMACLYFKLGRVLPRKSPAFGVYPIHLTDAGVNHPVFNGLETPFYAADFRSYQVVEPDEVQFETIGAEILALEKVRPHVPLERAIMAVRFSAEMIGMQFHPEVSPAIMREAIKDPHRRARIIEEDGMEKYQKMIKYLNDTSKMEQTYQHILPDFLRHIQQQREMIQ